MRDFLDHLFVAGYKQNKDFKSTLSVRKESPPQRPRGSHGRTLLRQLSQLAQDQIALSQKRLAHGLPKSGGMTIALEISPPGFIDYAKQLEWKRDGIEVLSASSAGETEVVALHVPDGKLSAFETRVRDYLNIDVPARKPGMPSKPKNAALINVIDSIRGAAFEDLWTDDEIAPPGMDSPQWVQIWLRTAGKSPKIARDTFADLARRFEINVEPGYVSFPGRTVIAARSTRAALEKALELLDMVAEIRGTSPTAEFYLSDLKPHEQARWVQNLKDRTSHSESDRCSYVTLLDTGVNSSHPLLAPHLHVDDRHAVHANWGTTDHDGHGTGMAGLCLHGDLTGPLSTELTNDIPHRLESVKILPPTGQNAPHLYGWVTSEATRKVEAAKGERKRTYAMMTTAIGKTTGLPSEWSASIDAMAFGLNGGESYKAGIPVFDTKVASLKRRLFVISAGNVPWNLWNNYPTQNDLFEVENPGQAWNAITVGACTDLVGIDGAKWPSLQPISGVGLLSPSSTTSLLWQRRWPFKPDVVAEGGNGSIDTKLGAAVTVGPESLRLLTTSHDMTAASLCESGDTSAAAAEVARICGHLQTRYPDYWPETIRALVVHGAKLTVSMRAQLPLVPLKQHKEAILRRYGYGRVDYRGSANSASNRPTLILQEVITPYAKDGSAIKLKELNMHDLPWPSQQLLDLHEQSVAMRVTLSYFVEPNPSQRGWQSKFRYQSHGLRFAVKGATETDERFGQRINKIDRDELEADEQESMTDPDREHWFLGAHLRSRGSIHSDVWIGTAAQLAQKSHIAVFPVGGWWKDWADSQRQDVEVRYALVVTLEVLSNLDIDLYTPIATQIGLPIATEIAIDTDGNSKN